MQRRVARLTAGLVEAEPFAVAGGAALIVHGIVVRATRDLDFFATASDAVAGVLPVLEEALRRDDLAVIRRRDTPGFARLEVTDEAGDIVEVDLAYDARILPAQESELGWVLHPDEVAADKMLALYGRAEARDVHDVAEALAAISRLRDVDFPDPQRADDLRRWFEEWRRELGGTAEA